MSYTVGDERELACPRCGKTLCFSDWIHDGWSGGETECEHCGGVIDVDVEYSVTLIARAK